MANRKRKIVLRCPVTEEERKEIEPAYENQAISESTSQKVLNMMESVVSEGTGKKD